MKILAKFILSLSFCLIISSDNTAWCQVEHAGALKNFMHKGDISSKIELKDLAGKKHLYALGAAGNLKGEILIIDGLPYVTSNAGGKIRMENSFESSASLLVYTQVEKWQETPIPQDVRTYHELEGFVESAAGKQKIDTSSPFPFLIKGVVKKIDWHVIDWDENDPVHTHDKHKKAGVNGTINGETVLILGFFSRKHVGVFTHHTTNMHLHFKSNDEKLAAHLDDLVLGNKATLFLPVIN